MSTIGKRLAEAREEKGWKQKHLAEKSGLSQTTISHIESGRNGSSKHLPLLAKTCGVHTEWLVTGEQPKYLGIAEPGASYTTETELLSAIDRLFIDAPQDIKIKAAQRLINLTVSDGVELGNKREK